MKGFNQAGQTVFGQQMNVGGKSYIATSDFNWKRGDDPIVRTMIHYSYEANVNKDFTFILTRDDDMVLSGKAKSVSVAMIVIERYIEAESN